MRHRTSRPTPADARLIQAASAARRFADWLQAAGEPCRSSGLRFPGPEFRERFRAVDLECQVGEFIPGTARTLLVRYFKSLRDEVKGGSHCAIELGTAFVAEVIRLADLLVFYATEAAQDAELPRRRARRLTTAHAGRPASMQGDSR